MKKLPLLLLITSSFSVFADKNLESLAGGFCYESSTTQVRNNLFFLPNQELPFTGENLCVYSKNGQYHSQGKILNGKQEGWWTWWKENGEVLKKEQYEDGRKIGYKKISLNKNSQIEREVIYQNQNYIGENRYLYYESGWIKGKYTKDNASNENMTVWYESGQIKAEGSFQNGEPKGKYTNWFENGQIKEKGNYIKGKLDGKVTNWYENGKKHTEGYFKKGIKDGHWTYWTRDGQIYKEQDLNSDEALKSAEQEALKAKAQKVFAEVKRKAEEAKAKEAEKQKAEAEALRKAEEVKTRLAEIKRKAEEARTKEAEILAKEAAKEAQKAELLAKEAEILAKEAEEKRIEEELKAKDAVKEAEKLAEEKAREAEILAQEVAKQVKKAEEKRKTEEAKAKEAEEKRKLEEEKVKKAEEKRKLEEEKLLVIEDQLNTLKSAYVSNIAARVKSMWRYQGAEDDWTCEVYVAQDRDGTVLAVDVRNCNVGNSSKAKAFKDSIRRAVYKASPLPSAPDESVFDKELVIKFSVN